MSRADDILDCDFSATASSEPGDEQLRDLLQRSEVADASDEVVRLRFGHVIARAVSNSDDVDLLFRGSCTPFCSLVDSVPEGKRALRNAFKDLERQLPYRGARVIRGLRHPEARWIRIPVGALCIVGGVFSFLPILGIWMLPLGLLLIACDVPFLRKPVARLTIWAVGKWTAVRHWGVRHRHCRPIQKFRAPG